VNNSMVTHVGVKPRRRLTLAQRSYLLALVLVLPAVLLRLFTTAYPFVQTAILSVQKYNPAFPPAQFVGLGNLSLMGSDILLGAMCIADVHPLDAIASTVFENLNMRQRARQRLAYLRNVALLPLVTGATGLSENLRKQAGIAYLPIYCNIGSVYCFR